MQTAITHKPFSDDDILDRQVFAPFPPFDATTVKCHVIGGEDANFGWLILSIHPEGVSVIGAASDIQLSF